MSVSLHRFFKTISEKLVLMGLPLYPYPDRSTSTLY